MATKKRIALIQMGAVHEELAPPFVDAILSLGYDAKVWLHPGSLSSKGDVFHAYNGKQNPKGQSGKNKNYDIIYRRLLKGAAQERFLKELKSDGIEHAIFLTLQNEWSINLAKKIQSNGIKVTGIIHNIDKLKNKLVSRFWKADHQSSPIVLAEHVGDSLQKELQLESKIVHSIFKPKQLPLSQENLGPSSQSRPYKFAILGGVNFQSRNYEALTDYLDRLPSAARKSILFTIAGGGKDRTALIDLVQEKNLESNFEFAKISSDSNRVKYGMYYRAIVESDAVLVLPGPGYAEKKITSALPSAITFGKPVITSSSLAAIYGLEKRGLSYSGETINEAILKFLNTTLLENFNIKRRVQEYRQELLSSNIAAIKSFIIA